MFRFGRVDELDFVRDKLQVTKSLNKKTASLHLRYCTRSADDHVNGYVDDSFYIECFKHIPDDVKVYIFSDDESKSETKLQWSEKIFPKIFRALRLMLFNP